jgi:MOSC domain-containing protein YiiM
VPVPGSGLSPSRSALTGRVVSLQVGRPAPLAWRGRTVTTAIVKQAVSGSLVLRVDGFDGDEQAGKSHGGPDKAACLYPVEHVPAWEELLGRRLPGGAFGENTTVSGLLEDRVHVGDVLSLGGALVQVSQPRGPCYKLAARWGRKDLPARMAREGISGFYIRVLREGPVTPGDPIELEERRSAVSVADVMRVTYRDRAEPEAVRAVMAVPDLAAQWRGMLAKLAARSALPLRDFGPGR